jgi:protein-tyrosine-phosphatase/N-acetylglutamate synthase-like GNAT family acetyltransferase
MSIVGATPEDEAAIRALLDASGLPTADLTTPLLRSFLVVRDGAKLAAVGALELVGGDALLRSVAVAPSHRGRGLGRQLVAALEAVARSHGYRRLYLLTTSADQYFEWLGFDRMARQAAPPELRATPEFSDLCPSSSVLMVKDVEPKIFNVLFLCTGNSARSILAQALANDLSVGRGRLKAYSAGSHPKGAVNPFALHLLERAHVSTAGLRSKSWDEFTRPGSPLLDFVFTVCDQAAGEACPYWPGQPVTAHWGMPDPAAVEGTDAEKRHAFEETLRVLRRRIELFASLPLSKLDRLALQKSVSDIGKQ